MQKVLAICLVSLLMGGHGLQRPNTWSRSARFASPLAAAAGGEAGRCCVVVTHAAGRMGTSLVAQLHESWTAEAPAWAAGREGLVVRAVVRTEEEASRLKIDLGGLRIRDGVAVPLLDVSPWLDVRVVPDGGDDEAALLAEALAGAEAVVLCSAAHAGFEVDGGTPFVKAEAVVPG
eukprot:CAMPEP_0119290532 /NCGR_PEP_ID=MMETSP1329-20130426/40874_1 /TAXON_ID=114041 /ORGANISM="Genus nov. species nov., Strain RCC1024" /LENGTH=175 /DNA_ID=CAMNT_0007291353 /DNA_START=55 /DNA_END=579 /DNA_ORIENTATION=+